MTPRHRNLLRTARFLDRLNEAADGDLEIEGIPASDISYDLRAIAMLAHGTGALDNLLHSVRVDALPVLPSGDSA